MEIVGSEVYEAEKWISDYEARHFSDVRFTDETINHLYVTYFPDRNEYEVELGFGENQSNSKMYKLRNIVSILKKQGL